jgi:hypothetical protein
MAPPGAQEDLLRRVRSEFQEMPGLRLTPAQARRLLGIDSQTCDEVLRLLERTQFLTRMRDGQFAWLGAGSPRWSAQ